MQFLQVVMTCFLMLHVHVTGKMLISMLQGEHLIFLISVHNCWTRQRKNILQFSNGEIPCEKCTHEKKGNEKETRGEMEEIIYVLYVKITHL